MKVSEFLSIGAHNAHTGKELKTILGITGRELRAAIRRERMQGVPICSRTHTDSDGQSGYYLPCAPHDYIVTIRSLYHREREIRRVRMALEKSFHERYGA